jgi:hypothetical protein
MTQLFIQLAHSPANSKPLSRLCGRSRFGAAKARPMDTLSPPKRGEGRLILVRFNWALP